MKISFRKSPLSQRQIQADLIVLRFFSPSSDKAGSPLQSGNDHQLPWALHICRGSHCSLLAFPVLKVRIDNMLCKEVLMAWSIRCLRNIIHWNLITTFILRNVMWFVLQMIDHNIHESNELWCRCITTIFNYFVVTNFFWMFVEGCYLHTAIVMTYSTDKLRKWVFLFIGWCIPCPIIIAWAVCKLYYENEQCWFGKEPGKYIDYIYQGPVILVLLINFVFLFNIVRILMTKLRASTTSETIQYRKAVKATLVLLPLLGITYMLFFVNPGEDDISQIFFIYFNSFLQSFQGFFVSVFYCFLNGEVRSAARKRWHRWQDHHSLRVRVARAMSIPTSPTRISFHSIKQTAAM
ncbi:hypothetical protein lerEdw1_019180 [Lerista edwardsae]|nr:hypothetical protein lerEdw1_019180 [Lerista edwardsae]